MWEALEADVAGGCHASLLQSCRALPVYGAAAGGLELAGGLLLWGAQHMQCIGYIAPYKIFLRFGMRWSYN